MQAALASLSQGDVLDVVRLDRLGRSLPYLIAVVRDLEAQGTGLLSLSETIDTTTPVGRLLPQVMRQRLSSRSPRQTPHREDC